MRDGEGEGIRIVLMGLILCIVFTWFAGVTAVIAPVFVSWLLFGMAIIVPTVFIAINAGEHL